MLKIVLHVVFTIAAVAGDAQPQNNGQNQILFSSLPPLQAYRPAQASSPVVAVHSIQSPRAIPCRRRNFGDLPNSGWMQVPLPYNQPMVNQHDSPNVNQPIPSQLKPQSLTENRAPVLDQNNEEERTGRNPEFPDEIIELVEQNSGPVQLSQKRNSDDDENLRSGRDPIYNDNLVVRADPSQNYLAYWRPNTESQDAGNDRIEGTPDCDKIGEQDQALRTDNFENNAEPVGRNVPGQVQEEAIKFLSKCIQEARNAEEDFEGDSRRAMPNSLTPFFRANNAETLPSKPVDSKPESPQDEDTRLAPHLQNPAKNAFKWGADSHISLSEHRRVCYACSSYFDPSCLEPNATTTIKYCNKDNNACVKKTFQVGGNSILIRDCGHTCNEADPYGVNPKIDSCSICYTDMCNGGYSINGFSALIALFAAAVKYL